MMAQASRDWSVFKQIFADHWQGFKQFRPRYDTPYYDSLVEKMLDCGNPDKMGYIEYRCLECGQGKHLVSMSCKSSLCLRCAKVHVDNWVSQVSKALHEGVIYRHIILTVPAMFRTPFYFDCLRTAVSLCSMGPGDYAVSSDTDVQVHCAAIAFPVHAAYAVPSRTDSLGTRSRQCPRESEVR
jgi:hypothetical protein